jgi:uncharacterized MAPEG superfamily protein
MTIANSCVVAAAVLPVLTVGLAKFTTLTGRGRYDNNDPRGWESKLDGWKARAVSAQNNGFEALPLFAFAVLAAQQAGLPQDHTDMLALAFIACRLVYVAVYLMNLGAVRTLVWTAGLACTIAIMAPVLKLAF